jgi:hypothetical protein
MMILKRTKSISTGKGKRNLSQKEPEGPKHETARKFQYDHNEIEEALFKRAKGFEYSECIIETDEETEEEKVVKRTKKTAIPDVTACIFWLKNRLPDKWKDPKDIDNEKQSLKDFLEHYYEED